MKKEVLFVAALACAVILTAGTASAKFPPKVRAVPGQTMWTPQSPTPPNPTVRTPVAGYSPNFAAPQPATKATLTTDANRLIRWQSWLDVDAFSVSVLNQMQRQLGNGIEVGSFSWDEPEIATAIATWQAKEPTFELCQVLGAGDRINFEDIPTLYVWTYRHNFSDSGLHQLYVSAKGKMKIGEYIKMVPLWENGLPPILHQDIQSLNYEFGDDIGGTAGKNVLVPRKIAVIVDIEIWRGAVVSVDSDGTLNLENGDEGFGLRVNYPNQVRALPDTVAHLPMSDWEVAPSLVGNPNYNPRAATGPAFVEPLERAISISGNSVQQRAGNVQQRVRTTTPWRYRGMPLAN